MTQTPQLHFTPKASEMLCAAVQSEEEADLAVRVEAAKVGVRRFRYRMDIVLPRDRKEDDLELKIGEVQVLVDPASAANLDGATIDFADLGGLSGSGFKFENPNEKASFEDPIAQRIHELIESDINPGVASHGGVIELIDYSGGVARVNMGGGCQGCGMAAMTLRQGVETRIKELIPEVTEVIDVTNHGAGENPFYGSE